MTVYISSGKAKRNETFLFNHHIGTSKSKLFFCLCKDQLMNFRIWPLGQEKKSFSTVRRVLLADIVRNHHQCQKTFFVARANTEFALFAHLTFFLNTKTFRPYYDGEAEVVSSSTLPLCNLFSRWHKWPRGWHPLFLISSEFLLALSDKKISLSMIYNAWYQN